MILKRTIGAFPALAFALACSNAGSDFGTGTERTKRVGVAAFLDRDGSGSFSGGDTVYAGVRVSLLARAGGQIFQTVTTGQSGDAEFTEVPVGEYQVRVDTASLGDSLAVGSVAPTQLNLKFDQDLQVVTIRLSYPEVTIRTARQEPPGRRVLIRGLVLVGVQAFGDTTSHVRDTSSQIRLTRVALRGGLTGNNPGDSVTALGVVSSRAGQPTLDQAIITLLGARPAPVPVSLSTGAAAGASAGVLDAGLVQITAAAITDTATVAPDFHVVGDDGSGPITVVLDAVGGFNRAAFILGRSMTIRGVLVPDGTGRWFLKPRNPGDIFVF